MKMHLFKYRVICLVILVSCSEEYELNRSIFIADKDYPSLPAYTEWGHNTFGVLYDREPFINDDFSVPAKIINTGGKTSFSLRGHVGGSRYYYPGNDNLIALNFDFYSFDPESWSDLVELNDTTIDLTYPLCKVSLVEDTVKYNATVLNGALHFRRAQNLIVDKQPYETILSGTFEFRALIKNEPSGFTSGRFDVGITSDNFFKY